MAQKKVAQLHIIEKKILNLLNENKEGLRAVTMQKLLDTTRRTLYNHLKSLEKKNLIINISPIWKIGTIQMSSKKWHSLLKSNNKLQAHKFSFVLPLLKKPDWWDKRQNRLMKLKEWQYKKRVDWHNNSYHQIKKDQMLIQAFKNSIYFINQKEYYNSNPYLSLQEAIKDVLEVIRFMEERFRFKFFQDATPQLSIVTQHHVSLNDELSKRCKKRGTGFIIQVNDEERILVDFSEPFGTETTNKDYAPEDMKNYLEEIKDRITNQSTPVSSEIWEITSKNTENIRDILVVTSSNQDLLRGFPIVVNKLEQQIESHLKLINEYRKENKRWRKKTKDKIKTQYEKQKEQKRLSDFFIN